MTANRAEQKGGGSMSGDGTAVPEDIGGPAPGITTAEKRAALEKAGWRLAERDGLREVWMHGEGCCIVPPTPTLHKAVEFAAILGIAPAGYTLLPASDVALLAKVIGGLSYRDIVTYGDHTEEEYRRLAIIQAYLDRS